MFLQKDKTVILKLTRQTDECKAYQSCTLITLIRNWKVSGAGVGDQLFSNISVQIERVYINNVVILVNP